MGNGSFEDIFPIENSDVSANYLSSSEGTVSSRVLQAPPLPILPRPIPVYAPRAFAQVTA